MGDDMADSLLKVGEFKKEYNILLNTNFPYYDIVQSSGLVAHVQKRHPQQIQYLNNLQDILNQPDYIGSNPNQPNSIELIKCYSDNILIAINLDSANEYYFIASLYEITQSKINNKLNSGRFKKYT
nr:MAG TPA: nuclease [Caudoviricetes sp.]